MEVKSCRSDIAVEALNAVQALLPKGFEHCICEADLGNNVVTAFIRVAGTTTDDMKKWLHEFSRTTKMTFRVDRTRPPSGQRFLANVEYRCMHNTRPRSSKADTKSTSKNTNCPAMLKIKLKQSEFKQQGYRRKSRSQDLHMPLYPMVVQLNLCHNHPVNAAVVLKHRDVGPETKESILELFKEGHSPASALETLKCDLQNNHPDDYIVYSNDRYYCPDLQWCQRLYYDVFRREYASTSDTEVKCETDLQHQTNLCNEGILELSSTVKQGEPVYNPLMQSEVAMGNLNASSQWFQSLLPHSDCHGINQTKMECTQPVAGATVIGATEQDSKIYDESVVLHLQDTFNKIVNMYKMCPSLGAAVLTFCRQTEKLVTTDALQSALNSFGAAPHKIRTRSKGIKATTDRLVPEHGYSAIQIHHLC